MSIPSPLVAEFTQSAAPGFQGIVSHLVDVIGGASVKLDTAVKWRQLTFAKEGDFHHWICAIALSKKSVNLIFHFGGLLDDSTGAFVIGSSKFLRR